MVLADAFGNLRFRRVTASSLDFLFADRYILSKIGSLKKIYIILSRDHRYTYSIRVYTIYNICNIVNRKLLCYVLFVFVGS